MELLKALSQRFLQCGLELHPEKTKIIYCGDSKRRKRATLRKFSFLGYEFRGRKVTNRRTGEMFTSFTPAICPKALKSIRQDIRKEFSTLGSHISLETVARHFNPRLRGWMNYYGHFSHTSLGNLSHYFNQCLRNWARHKYGKLFRRRRAQWKWLHNRFKERPNMFAHWKFFKVCSMGAG